MNVNIGEFTTTQGHPLTKNKLTRILKEAGYYRNAQNERAKYRLRKTETVYEVVEMLKWSVVMRKLGTAQKEIFPIEYFKNFFIEVEE